MEVTLVFGVVFSPLMTVLSRPSEKEKTHGTPSSQAFLPVVL